MGRILEPEVMEDPEETAAYANAASQEYLDKLDNTFVQHALSQGIQKGAVLDVGCGPAKIPAKMLRVNHNFYAVVLDLSGQMVRIAKETAKKEGLSERMDVVRGDSKRLPIRNSCFELVISNSLIHHLADPLPALNEMHRVTTEKGAVLVRDLKRPSSFLFRLHATIFGRHYYGKMRELYENSLRAAFSPKELQEILRKSSMNEARIFRKSVTHIGIERPPVLHSAAE